MKFWKIFFCLPFFIIHTLMSKEISIYVVSNDAEVSDPVLFCKMDMETGRLTPGERYSGVVSPSYLCLSPDQKYLYSTVEKAEGEVAAWKIDRLDGKLEWIGTTATGGSGPCHLSVTQDGNLLLVSNYNSGQISVLPINTEGGLSPLSQLISLEGSGPDKTRQESSHMHCIRPTPVGNLILATDLGSDKIMIFRYDAVERRLVANEAQPALDIAPGSGPRHFAFHPILQSIYLLNELSASVDVIAYDAEQGTMEIKGSYPLLPSDFTGSNKSAAIRVHPSGKYLYGSNRGDLDSISIFRILEDGSLEFVALQTEKIHWPRDFNIDPSGRFLLSANRSAGEIRVFEIDLKTGLLSDTGHFIQMDKPVCVLFGNVF
jgi:6-phosphogluconolactonase